MKNNELSVTILTALAKLDQKGTDESITRAMAIVFEGFRLDAAKKKFSPDELFESALSC